MFGLRCVFIIIAPAAGLCSHRGHKENEGRIQQLSGESQGSSEASCFMMRLTYLAFSVDIQFVTGDLMA
jgi:hypothetical protein